MIVLEDRIRAFSTVGHILKNMRPSERATLYQGARAENSWFTEDTIDLALQGLQQYLDEAKLRQWTQGLPPVPASAKKVGVVMAGNIPLVGFHDFLTVLISGHTLWAKLSSQDSFLLKYIAHILLEIEPRFQESLVFAERLRDVEAIIATGSDNSSRYFEYYFAKYPHIIRKNRTSAAVLNGTESEEELYRLGQDVFQYYGLGCRNVSKLYVPENYSPEPLLDAWQPYQGVLNHHKYQNNYDYIKSIYLVNGEPMYDTGFVLLRESPDLVSPIATVFYEQYQDEASLTQTLAAQRGAAQQSKIQCIVSQNGWLPDSIPFGQAQQPELWDYADEVDTLAFVNGL